MIPVTYRASFSYLLRHPWQLGLALLGISIGVAVIVAVDLANSSARSAFLLSMDAVAGEATHQVIGGPNGVDESVYTGLRVGEGIRNIAPVLTGELRVEDVELQLMGIDLFAERDMRSYTNAAATAGDRDDPQAVFRDFLIEPGAVMMSAGTAGRLGLAAGDSFSIRVAGRPHTAALLATFDDSNGGLDDLLVTDIATAQTWLDKAGWLSRIDVRITPGDDALLARLEAALPDGARVLSAAGRTQATAAMSDGFMTNLTAMSLLALLVGVFLILNSVSFSVVQRRNLIGTLRALGVTRRQLFAMLLVEAACIGLVAAVAGVLLGIVLGEQLLDLVARSINDLYFRVRVTDVSVSAWSVVKGLLAGVGAALLATLVPAIEATSYTPRLAMTRSALEQRTRSAMPRVALAGLGAIGIAVLLLAASGRNLPAGLVAVFILILGFALCAPLLVRIGSAALAPLAGRVGGTPARMAVAGIGAGLSRTGVAVVALSIAVATTIGVSVMVDSFRGSVSDWLDQTLRADLYANRSGASLDEAFVARAGRIDGVQAVSSNRQVWLEQESGRTLLVVIRMAPGSYAGTDILDADPADVWPAWETTDTVLVSEPYAYQHGVSRGDVLRLPTDRGVREFEIAASFRSYDINASAVMMSRAIYVEHFDDRRIDSIGLYLDDARSTESVTAALQQLDDEGAQLQVRGNAGIRELSLEVFDRTFVITDVLYWLAMGVAFVGILSAMLALQLERARETATLRALGMTPAEVGGMITVQTGVLGLLSGLAAIPLGLIMAWVLIVVINRRAFGWQIDMAVAPGILATSVSFAIVAALLAGIYPALRAARSSPALAMREE